jgi:hypothetical protein
MPLLNPTPAQLAAQQVQNLSLAGFKSLQQFGLQGFNLIWNNRNATPQQVIAALGAEAAAVFALSALNNQTIASAAQIGGVSPPNMPAIPTGWTVTANPDGTVTLTPPASSN